MISGSRWKKGVAICILTVLLGGGADPTPELVAAASLIEAAGADFIAMPCNSAHAFLASIRKGISIPVLDMIRLAAGVVARVVPRARKIGVLATTGTVSAGLYEEPLRDHGLEPLYPDGAVQDGVMAAIKEVKAGRDPRSAEGHAPASDARLVSAARHLGEGGADCLVMGCTEVPLALAPNDSPIVAIDGNQALVDATLALAVGRLDFEDVVHAVR